jgi:hypothetical protein
MSDDTRPGPEPQPGSRPGPARDAAAERARRRARVFGDVLPESTRDDRDDTGEASGRGGTDHDAEEWLRRQVPPHHG